MSAHMTGKQRMLAAFAGRHTDVCPAALHSWGLYKFQLAGIIGPDYAHEGIAWRVHGRQLADIELAYYRTFQPDMLQLSGGPGVTRDGAWHSEVDRLRREVHDLKSKRDIDELMALLTEDTQEVIGSDAYSHVRMLADEVGEEVLILMNEGNPICGVLDPHGLLGFENGLIMMIEKPDMFAYLCYKWYEAALPRMRALKAMGAHGYIGSETYCSCDIMSPDMIRDLILPAIRMFNGEIDAMGLIPVTYYLGDVMPILEDICGIGCRALMVEESKKGFKLDIPTIYKKLNGRMALFGNVDGVELLLRGSAVQVRQETLRQVRGAGPGFIATCGSPIAFDTPPENIHALLSAARSVSYA